MGLSASQSRFLVLTARKSNIEFEAQKLTQAKIALASNMDTEAYLWSNGMNVQHLYYSNQGGGSAAVDLPRLTYQLVTQAGKDGGLGMRVRDSFGREVVAELPVPMPEGRNVGDYCVDPYCYQADYFEKNLMTGNWMLQKHTESGLEDVGISGAPFIYQGIDSGDYAVALNEYEEKTRSMQRKEKQFDMRIEQLSAERKAVETELESVKKVIDKNIEETFKTFG